MLKLPAHGEDLVHFAAEGRWSFASPLGKLAEYVKARSPVSISVLEPVRRTVTFTAPAVLARGIVTSKTELEATVTSPEGTVTRPKATATAPPAKPCP